MINMYTKQGEITTWETGAEPTTHTNTDQHSANAIQALTTEKTRNNHAELDEWFLEISLSLSVHGHLLPW